MPTVQLNDDGLSDVIAACRTFAVREEAYAKTMTNPEMQRGFEESAGRFEALVRKLSKQIYFGPP